MKSDNILKKSISILTMIVLVTFSFKACNKEDYPIGSIKLTTAASQVRLVIETTKKSDNLSINWGDGKMSNLNEAIMDDISDWLYFSHEYSDNTARNIIITGNIKMLICSNNQLTALDVSQNLSLKNMNCSNNQLSFLDVSKNKELLYLYCNRNSLTSLDVSRVKSLETLECDFNQLTNLDISGNSLLTLLSCVGNQLTTSSLNDLFRSLPNYRGLEYSGVLYISHQNPGILDNPGSLFCDRHIAEKKGWLFMTKR